MVQWFFHFLVHCSYQQCSRRFSCICFGVTRKHVRVGKIFENWFRVDFGEKVSIFGLVFRSPSNSSILRSECYFTFDIVQIHQMRHIFSPDWYASLWRCCQLPRRDTLMKHFTDLACNAPMCPLGVDVFFISLHHWFVAGFVSKLNKYFTNVQFVLLVGWTNICSLGNGGKETKVSRGSQWSFRLGCSKPGGRIEQRQDQRKSSSHNRGSGLS